MTEPALAPLAGDEELYLRMRHEAVPTGVLFRRTEPATPKPLSAAQRRRNFQALAEAVTARPRTKEARS